MNAGIDGELIRKLRTTKSWSQEELGQIAGLSARTIQRIETEGSSSLDSRRALASAFGLTPEDLLAAQPGSVSASASASDRPGDPQSGNPVYIDRPRLGAGYGAMLWTSMAMTFIAIMLLVAVFAIQSKGGRPAPVSLILLPGTALMLGLAVSAYCLWVAANTSYLLSAEGLQVRYGPHHRCYRWDDFVTAYWQGGLLPLRLAFQPVTRLSEVVSLVARDGGRTLDLTPQDTAGFMRQMAVFAPRLVKATVP